MKPLSSEEVLTVLFLMLGPFKIIGPFARITRGTDLRFARRLAILAIVYSLFALLIAGFLGERLLARYGIPVSVLALSAGIVLFLVALPPILQEFKPPVPSEREGPTPTLGLALTPLAFPTIVTPYGIAAVIVFEALGRNAEDQLRIGLIVLAIMLVNLVAMLLAQRILRSLGVFLEILAAVLAIIQVALSLQVILTSFLDAWHLMTG